MISEFIETPEDEQAEALEGENSSENEYFSPRLTGSIKRLFPQKAFGFITGSDGKDYFFHLTDLQGVEFANLSDGDRVEFEIEKPASESKAGSAQSVRPFKEVDEDEEAEEYLEE